MQKAFLFYLKLQHTKVSVDSIQTSKKYLFEKIINRLYPENFMSIEDKIISHLITIGHDLESD
jgi:hypothetical protein